MTNLTKAIAALGVVAGLGVAALPLTSYAETTPVVWREEADTNTPAGWGGTGSTSDPMWVAKPVGVQLKIEEGLQMAVTDKAGEGAADANLVDFNKGNYDEATSTYTSSINVNVIANNKSGYHLKIAGTNSETGHEADLVSGTNTIAAGDLTGTTSSWGYKIGEATTWTGVTKNGAVIATETTPTGAAGKDTTVTFGAKVADDQAAGTYTGQVTFTATAGPEATAPGV